MIPVKPMLLSTARTWPLGHGYRLEPRCDRLVDEEGQSAAEYIGIILVVGAILAVLVKHDEAIANAIGHACGWMVC